MDFARRRLQQLIALSTRWLRLETYQAWLADSDYALPIRSWNATTHVLLSILLASLVINLLSLAFPLALLQIYDRIIPNNAMSTLILLSVGVGVALIIEGVFRVARSYVGGWADSKFEHVMGCEAFKSLVESKLTEFEKEGAGIHLKRMNALSMLREYYAGQMLIAVADVPFILLLLAIIAYIAQWIVFVPIILVTAYILLTMSEAKKLQTILRQRFDQDERRFNFIIETLNNIHTVKAVGMEAQMQRRYERLQKISAVHDYEISLKGAVSTVSGVSVSQLMVIFVVAIGSVFVVNGALTIGGLAACTILSGRCLQPINLIVGLWTRLQTIKLANDELKQVLAMPRECSITLPEFPKCRGDIKMEQVCFRYDADQPWLFNKLSVHIKQNETIAITSKGAKGKSTLIWLLMGLLQPGSGRVFIDDLDIRQFQSESVRRQFAYLPQKPVIFKGTIMENLTIFNTVPMQDHARRVCDILGLSELIERLPKGYDTMLGDQTADTLSRGFNQRITIARALIQNPRIVIFDEANSGMDQQGDAVLRAAIEQIKGSRTMILISFRPSILKLADIQYQLTSDGLIQVGDDG